MSLRERTIYCTTLDIIGNWSAPAYVRVKSYSEMYLSHFLQTSFFSDIIRKMFDYIKTLC